MLLKLFVCLALRFCGLQSNHTLHKHKLKTLEMASIWEKNKHFFFFFFLLYKQMSLSHLRPGWQIIFLAQFFFFLSFFPLSPQLQIHAWECLVISCVCSTQPVPDVPVQRGRCSSTAPVATPSSQVGMLLLYLFLWYENTYCFRFIDCYFAMWH